MISVVSSAFNYTDLQIVNAKNKPVFLVNFDTCVTFKMSLKHFGLPVRTSVTVTLNILLSERSLFL